MSLQLRDQIKTDTAIEAPRRTLRDWMGIPRDNRDSAAAWHSSLDLTLTGLQWAVLGQLCALALAFILIPLGQLQSAAFWAGVAPFLALALLPEGLLLLPTIQRRAMAARALPILIALSLCSWAGAAGWAGLFGMIHATSSGAGLAVMLTMGIGLLATMALPILFAQRALAAGGLIIFAMGLTTRPEAIAGLTLAALLSIIMTIRINERRIRSNAELNEAVHAGWRNADLVRAFEESGRGWFWQTNARGRLTYITPALADRIGVPLDTMIGSHFAQLVSAPDSDAFELNRDGQNIEFTLGAGIPFHDQIVRAPGEEVRWWSLSGIPALDAHGRCIGFNGSGTDLTERERAEADASRLANFDSLTGLPNRSSMRHTLEELLDDEGGIRTPHCGLFLLDLDRFKNVNDTLGHPMGDALLKIVAQRLARVVGTQGQVGRLGGDEFKVIVPDVSDSAKLAELADAIIARLSLPYVIDDCTIQIGATVGIAIAPSDGDCPDELTRNADLALYAAKAAGKGVHRFYSPEMHSDANDRRAIENDLREVLHRGELAIHYQPVVDADSEALVGFEALVRWHHPERGDISPAIFVPIAEEINLIGRIGEWVLRTACAEAASWPDHLRIAVNLSPLQFTTPGLPGILLNALADSGIAPERLELEVTEGVLLNDDPIVDRNLAALAKMGVHLSLDDFGTGYASLAYLKRVPFHKVKIDRSFVRGAADQERNQAIIRAMVGLAESLDMETVAEGAETLDEIDLIRSLGCSQIQGYIFGYPIPAEEARRRALASRPAEDRREPAERPQRLALLRVARLHSLDHEARVKIRNISANGAMIEAPGNVPLGLRVSLELADGWAFAGEVRWRRGNRFGVEFDRPIAVREFVLGEPPPAEAPPPALDAPAWDDEKDLDEVAIADEAESNATDADNDDEAPQRRRA